MVSPVHLEAGLAGLQKLGVFQLTFLQFLANKSIFFWNRRVPKISKMKFFFDFFCWINVIDTHSKASTNVAK